MRSDPLRELSPRDFDEQKAHHLLNRVGFGGTPQQVREYSKLGLSASVDSLVEFDSIPNSPDQTARFSKDIMQPPSERRRREAQQARKRGDEIKIEKFRRERQMRQVADRKQMGDIRAWWLRQMIESPKPFEEKMTLFWHGHFATNYRAIEDSYHMFMQNQLFRSFAVGNFKKLVHSIIRDPAMLRYLNNNQNRRSAPNENLARELMELFTLGEGNEYSESDIKEGARALTGFTYHDDSFIDRTSPQYQRGHDKGKKVILGQTGNWDGDDFVSIIFSRDAVSQFICWKLYRYFVDDRLSTPNDESRDVILKLAEQLRANRYELRPVLTTLFKSAHFYDTSHVASVIKSPVQLIVQAIRSLQTPSRNIDVLLSSLDTMGQNLFFPPSVQGWEGGKTWINTSTLFTRHNAMIYLLTGRQSNKNRRRNDGEIFDATELLTMLNTSANNSSLRDRVVSLMRFCLGTEPHSDRTQTMIHYVNERGGQLDNPTLVGMLALITAMPEYQLC